MICGVVDAMISHDCHGRSMDLSSQKTVTGSYDSGQPQLSGRMPPAAGRYSVETTVMKLNSLIIFGAAGLSINYEKRKRTILSKYKVTH